MNRRFVRDLQAWEAGELSLATLSARYPSEEVNRLTGLFSEMRSLSSDPAPNPNKGWNMVRSRMAAHIEREPMPLMQRLRPGIQRRLAFGMAAAILVVPPVAFAASNPDAVNGLVGDITVSIFGDDQQGAAGSNVGGQPSDTLNAGTFSSNGPGSGQSVGTTPGGAVSKKSQAAVDGLNGASAALIGTPAPGASAGTGAGSRSGGIGKPGSAGDDTTGKSVEGADAKSDTITSTAGAKGADASGSTGATSPSSSDTPSKSTSATP